MGSDGNDLINNGGTTVDLARDLQVACPTEPLLVAVREDGTEADIMIGPYVLVETNGGQDLTLNDLIITSRG